MRLPVLVLLIIWIFIVGFIFWLIPEKRIAGVIAGTGFIAIPSLILFLESKRSKKNSFVLGASVVFLFFSALPIFLLRVLNWDTEFQQLSLFGISSEYLHRSSNILYGFMLLAVVVAMIQERSPAK